MVGAPVELVEMRSAMWVKCGYWLEFARVITHVTHKIACVTMWVISHVGFQLGLCDSVEDTRLAKTSMACLNVETKGNMP